MSVNNSLLKSMQTIVDKSIEIAPFDKTRQAQVVTNNADGTYAIRLDGVLYSNVISYPKSTSITEGSVVKIVMPTNQPSQMYIVTPKGGGGDHLEITQEDYDNLPTDKKQGDTVFFVTESEPEYLIMSDSVPIGAIQSYGGNVAPSGWLICDGRAISRTEYSELFYVIGTTYGSGDGSTTFNIPDLKGRTLVGVGNSGATGSTNHTLGQKSGKESAPEHKHNLLGTGVALIGNFSDTLAFNNSGVSDDYLWSKWGSLTAGGTSYTWTHNADAAVTESTPHYNEGRAINLAGSTGNRVVYSSDDTNMQPYIVANYIIKAKQPPTENVIKGLNTQEILIDAFYPVGTEYSTTNSAFDPNVAWGGTWTKTTVSDDEIVEQGTSGIWTYRKWESGIAECWGRWEGSLTQYWTMQAGATWYGYNTSIAYPFTFIENPTRNYTTRVGSGFSWTASEIGASPSSPTYYAIGLNTGATDTVTFNIHAKGKWKTYTAPSLKYVWHRTA